ncbi:MAG: fumarylacetoacetate hydrolase family protein, partial [Armatimonadota bacterium]
AVRQDTLVGPVESVRLLPPVPRPNKLFALAGNYMDHIKESARAKPLSISAVQKAAPHVFMKPPSTTLIGPREPVVIPRVAQFIDYEAELALVIGKKARYVKANDAADYIFGYTCFNDISERRLRIWKRPNADQRDRWFDWLNGKWGDGFAPMGPCLVPASDVGDPHDLRIRLRLNGETMQDANTADMLFDCYQIVEYISHILTLEPGDVIAMGTPGGVGVAREPEVCLKPGDRLEVEIENIGILENPVECE